VSVDRRDHRRRVIKDGEKGLGHRGEEGVGVFGRAVEDRAQVDTRREAGARPGEDDRPVDAPDRGDRVFH
jgi:hypothetical protein